jgi:hypothetical protein
VDRRQIVIQAKAPQVEQRPLALYDLLATGSWESAAAGGVA